MLKQDKVKELYFDYKLKQVEISKILNVSPKYISKILITDNRYKEEKERRKINSQKKHIQKTKEYMKNKRKCCIDFEYEFMKQQHNQAIIELSCGKNHINNYAFRKWNSSAYSYNEKSKTYRLVKNITAGYDVPKSIKIYI